MTWGRTRAVAGLLVAAFLVAVLDDPGSSSELPAVVEPLSGDLAITLRSPDPVREGKKGRVVADVSNGTGVDLTGLVAQLHVDSSGLIVVGGGDTAVRDLKAGADSHVAWKVIGAEVGLYVIVADIAGTTPGQNRIGAFAGGEVLEVIVKKKK